MSYINGKDYYVSNTSKTHALESKMVRKLIGVDSFNAAWFETNDGEEWVKPTQFNYIAEIPEDKYIPWTEETVPLYGLLKGKASGCIYTILSWDNFGIATQVGSYSWDKVFRLFNWIPDPKKPNEILPAGSKVI